MSNGAPTTSVPVSVDMVTTPTVGEALAASAAVIVPPVAPIAGTDVDMGDNDAGSDGDKDTDDRSSMTSRDADLDQAAPIVMAAPHGSGDAPTGKSGRHVSSRPRKLAFRYGSNYALCSIHKHFVCNFMERIVEDPRRCWSNPYRIGAELYCFCCAGGDLHQVGDGRRSREKTEAKARVVESTLVQGEVGRHGTPGCYACVLRHQVPDMDPVSVLRWFNYPDLADKAKLRMPNKPTKRRDIITSGAAAAAAAAAAAVAANANMPLPPLTLPQSIPVTPTVTSPAPAAAAAKPKRGGRGAAGAAAITTSTATGDAPYVQPLVARTLGEIDAGARRHNAAVAAAAATAAAIVDAAGSTTPGASSVPVLAPAIAVAAQSAMALAAATMKTQEAEPETSRSTRSNSVQQASAVGPSISDAVASAAAISARAAQSPSGGATAGRGGRARNANAVPSGDAAVIAEGPALTTGKGTRGRAARLANSGGAALLTAAAAALSDSLGESGDAMNRDRTVSTESAAEDAGSATAAPAAKRARTARGRAAAGKTDDSQPDDVASSANASPKRGRR